MLYIKSLYHLYCSKATIIMLISYLCFVQIEKLPVIEIKLADYSKLLSKNISKTDYSGKGAYGRYYKLSSKKGIKLLEDKYITYDDALNGYRIKEAIKEVELLREAKSRYKNIPTCYGIKIIEKQGIFRIGIVMQHLGETTAMDVEGFTDEKKCKLEKDLLDIGIKHRDLHLGNIMFYKNDYYIIDFTPCNVQII